MDKPYSNRGYDAGAVHTVGARLAREAVDLDFDFDFDFAKPQKDKTPTCLRRWGFRNSILTMTYSHMGKPHTTIGDASFHY